MVKIDKPLNLSDVAIEMLTGLKESLDRGQPFRDCSKFQAKLRHSLVRKDLVVKSEGVDGSVCYKITSRGIAVLKNQTYLKNIQLPSHSGELKIQQEVIRRFFRKYPHKYPIYQRIEREVRNGTGS